ncbi:unnamed protein product (macronuclear) [Paramecium tetraurelia]|uniref:Chromosome undetermined scaffold_17, whole genome shotgun sequence n=1 Tax=Paramecium tetraurelia TaxID=5888 RepID=Q3SD99_PARTE|nr:uncharacterized protein GSPATT00006992001 [Paramecium tetraurelia]CAI44464.1 Mini antigen [Paramecium tetraurelia]CAK68781.1 unnamed protein product [Paramecium tetraurelia]|eukprot:XP_001436178.1 hypothetical protein (macronuclear) [Paramecium tetraurelia strain d4-2]
MEFIIVSLLLISTFGWVVKIENQCSCSQYRLQAECVSSLGCRWNINSNLCLDIQCNSIKTQAECLQYSQSCSFNYSTLTCATFTSCKNLSGNTVSQCQIQNPMCLWVSGNSCIDYDCQNFNLNSCPQFCINTGTACENFPTCEKLNQTYCSIYSGVCNWNSNRCQNYECSNFVTISQCQFVMESENTIKPCYWNQTQCINAPDASVFNANQCFIQTAGKYHWSSNNSTAGTCEQCYGSSQIYEPLTQYLSKGLILNIIVVGIFMVI